MERTAYFEPQKSDSGWTSVVSEKDFLQFGDIPPNVTYKCGKTTFTFPSVVMKSVGSFGPPLIPFPFPIVADKTEDSCIYLDFKYESPDNITKVIASKLIVKERKREPFKILSIETKMDSLSAFRYIFGENWNHTDSFVFEIVTSDPDCGTITIPYYKEFHVTYSMF